jgi:hypothetical protein
MTAMTQARAAALLAVAGILISAMAAYAQAKKPNILVIWGGTTSAGTTSAPTTSG